MGYDPSIPFRFERPLLESSLQFCSKEDADLEESVQKAAA